MAKNKREGITFTAHISPDCSPETKKALAEMLKHLAEQIESGGLTQLAADVCPDCKGEGIVKDGFSQLFECARCHGSGHAAKA